MKALSIAALVALLATSTITPAFADHDDCNRFRGQNFRGNLNNGNWNNSGWNNGNWNNGNWNNGRWNNGFYNRFNPYGNIDQRQAVLNGRIQQGITNGRLSAKEAARIQARYNKIAELEAKLRSSGNRLSFNERARLNADLSRLSAQLNRELWDRNNRRFW